MESKVEVIEMNALVAQSRAEIDSQVATAKAYPRSIKQVMSDALTMATFSEEVAASCWYSVPRAGKRIEGPSVRLAEIMISAYGNLRAQTRVISEDDRFLTAQAAVHDLEKNTAIQIETRRRITNKENVKYNDDMITNVANAARSIALRDAVFRIVPRTYVDEIMAACRKTAAGDAQTFQARRDAAMLHFNKLGIDAERVCAAVERKSVDDLTADDLLTLRGMANAIKDGAATLDESFPKPEKDAGKSAADKIKEKVSATRDADAAAAPKPGMDGDAGTKATEESKPKVETKRTGDTKGKATTAKVEKPAPVVPDQNTEITADDIDAAFN